MIYYFSGAYNQPLKIEMNCDQLFSAYHERKLVKKTIQYKKEHPEYTGKIMLDSGAFTHFQQMKKQGKELTEQDIKDYTDDYLKFLDEVGDDLEIFVGVDSVPDPGNVDPTYADRTWDNYLYMYDKLRPELRDKLIPVFHYGEDFKHLKRFLEYRHEDGSPIAYIGLAISLEGTRKIRIQWGQEAERIIAESSNPNVKYHAFGVGVKSVLDYLHATSTDATSWVKRAAFGMISIEDKTIYVSDVQKENIEKGSHYTERSTEYQKSVEEEVAKRGFTMSELEVDPYARAKFNILDTQMWMEELNKKLDEGGSTLHNRVELW